MIKIRLSVLIMLSIVFYGFSQSIDPTFLRQSQLLNYNNELPKNIISSRTAVFISCPYGTSSNQNNWKEIAGEVHKGLKKSSIDAVAYYHLKDIYAGNDASKAFAEDLKKREIKNLAFVVIDPNAGDSKFSLTVVPFSGDENFIAPKQNAWKAENRELAKIINDLYLQVSNGGYEKSNYLIIDQPEFFEDTRINKGKRFEMFLSDLKLDKLAVQKFEVNEGTSKKNENAKANQEDVNSQGINVSLSAENTRLEGIMSTYPFKYEIVDGSRTEDQLRKAGIQYVLVRINTSEQAIKDLLNYPADKNVSAEVKNFEEGIRTEPVYKYYIRHIYSGDIYLGNEWDAASTWWEALENHISNLRKELKVVN